MSVCSRTGKLAYRVALLAPFALFLLNAPVAAGAEKCAPLSEAASVLELGPSGASALNPRRLEDFLDSRESADRVRLGVFQIDLSKTEVLIGTRPKKALTIEIVFSSTLGSGRYLEALEILKEKARARGYEVLLLKSVAVLRHQDFYERNGFKKVPGSGYFGPDFYVDLSRPESLQRSEAPRTSFKAVNPAQFRQAYLALKHPKHPDRIWLRTEEEFLKDGVRLFLSGDGRVGFGIDSKDELVSLFNNGTQGLGADAVRAAIQKGVRHLHCWGEDLVRYYERFGFAVKKEYDWKEEYWINDDPPPDPKPKLYYLELIDK